MNPVIGVSVVSWFLQRSHKRPVRGIGLVLLVLGVVVWSWWCGPGDVVVKL